MHKISVVFKMTILFVPNRFVKAKYCSFSSLRQEARRSESDCRNVHTYWTIVCFSIASHFEKLSQPGELEVAKVFQNSNGMPGNERDWNIHSIRFSFSSSFPPASFVFRVRIRCLYPGALCRICNSATQRPGLTLSSKADKVQTRLCMPED